MKFNSYKEYKGYIKDIEKQLNKVWTIRNPYHIDNIVQDLESFKKNLNNPYGCGVIMCSDEIPKIKDSVAILIICLAGLATFASSYLITSFFI